MKKTSLEYRIVALPEFRYWNLLPLGILLTAMMVLIGTVIYNHHVIGHLQRTVRELKSELIGISEELKKELLNVEKEVKVKALLDEYPVPLSERTKRMLAKAMITAAEVHELELPLLMALIFRESTFNAYAVSPTGALGLMQVLPSTARPMAEKIGIRWEGRETLFDPFLNLEIGSAYLSQLMNQFGSEEMALAAYYRGPDYVSRRLSQQTAAAMPYVRHIKDTEERYVVLLQSER